MSTPRYQKLAPFSTDQSICVALAALRFFQPSQYEINRGKLGMPATPGKTLPLTGTNFLKYLELPGELPQGLLPEPGRHLQRIRFLLQQLVRAGLLSDMGVGSAPLLGNQYYTLYEATSSEAKGVLLLARALGPAFLHWAYKEGTFQITGATQNGDEHAGTGIAIAPRWLLTCAHVVNDMTVHREQMASGREFSVVREVPHPTVDVALLEVDRDLDVVRGLNFRDPHIGERVFTFGYPRVPLSREAALVMQGGEISVEQVVSLQGEELFLFSAIARPGNSGGPILSENGHVVGIVTKELSENDPLKVPFHAGIATSTLCKAVGELDCGIELPVETWQ